jgi:hypothetical protein
MAQPDLIAVLGRALTDKIFYKALTQDIDKALKDAHIHLRDNELKALKDNVLGKHRAEFESLRRNLDMDYDKYN